MDATGRRLRHPLYMEQIAPEHRNGIRKKPHPALVVAAISLAVGLWFVIYAVSGRVIWLW
jgi:hypothetical protein